MFSECQPPTSLPDRQPRPYLAHRALRYHPYRYNLFQRELNDATCRTLNQRNVIHLAGVSIDHVKFTRQLYNLLHESMHPLCTTLNLS